MNETHVLFDHFIKFLINEKVWNLENDSKLVIVL